MMTLSEKNAIRRKINMYYYDISRYSKGEGFFENDIAREKRIAYLRSEIARLSSMIS